MPFTSLTPTWSFFFWPNISKHRNETWKQIKCLTCTSEKWESVHRFWCCFTLLMLLQAQHEHPGVYLTHIHHKQQHGGYRMWHQLSASVHTNSLPAVSPQSFPVPTPSCSTTRPAWWTFKNKFSLLTMRINHELQKTEKIELYKSQEDEMKLQSREFWLWPSSLQSESKAVQASKHT